MSISFVGPGTRLPASGIVAMAVQIGVPAANLQAVVEVETSGSGFDSQGRPIILFEPSQFWSNLPEGERPAAQSAGLAAPNWGQIPYAKGNDANYARLEQAMTIDQDAALKSCSWGMGQVMGSNYAMLRYASVEAMVADAVASEMLQLGQMCSFIKHAGALGLLARGEWAEFARVYNGPGYAKYHYDTKLAAYAAAAAAKAPRTAIAAGQGVQVPVAPQVSADQLMAAELQQLNGGPQQA